jgi:exodeoxyribonuclease V alpha subunit
MTDRQPIEGLYSIQRVTYANEDTGYAVVYLVPADRDTSVGFTAVGTFGQPRTGECYRIRGVWHRDPRHGLQVKVESATPETPRSLAAIERYLSGATIKGLGPHHARALVKHFGTETFSELQAGGPRLEEVPGIGPVRAGTIRASWAEHEGRHQLMINLEGVARLTPRQAQALFRQYGQEAWQVVSANPYRLAEDVRGFGFRTCDRIARNLGLAVDSPERLRAGLLYLLGQHLEGGHLWSPLEESLQETAALLEVPAESLGPQVEHLVAAGRLVCEDVADVEGGGGPALALPHVHRTERAIAGQLAFLLAQPPAEGLDLAPRDAEAFAARRGSPTLSDEQRRAVAAMLSGARIGILTGGPGTGKTTTLRLLIDCLEARRVSYALCATTGRASKQLASSTGRPAATVHRHLRIGIGAAAEKMRETVLVVDESSMIDLWLMHEILQRLDERHHLLLVGDVDQLPSVGPGAILQDLIALGEADACPSLSVTRLSRIFRQEAGAASMVVENCHRVRRGERPIREVPKTSDYFEMHRETPAEARDLAVQLAAERLPAYLRVPPSEVQVLTPIHSGEAGTAALNAALQARLNPPGPHKAEHALGPGPGGRAGRVFRVGDKVRQTRNDYEKQVLNGDLGVIQAIDAENEVLTVLFDDRSATYGFDETDEIVHAWAMTVHSAQGSQWPAVVVVLLTAHYVMLERNILYTALSRAERLAVLLTQEQAVRLAVSQDRSTRRRTRLVDRIAEAQAAPLRPAGGQGTLC